MYQRVVSSSPRSVAASISSNDAVAVGSSSTRLSTAAVAGAVVFSAHARGRIKLATTPPSIQLTAGAAMPLSNTEAEDDDPLTTWKGAHPRPGSKGLLRSVSG